MSEPKMRKEDANDFYLGELHNYFYPDRPCIHARIRSACLTFPPGYMFRGPLPCPFRKRSETLNILAGSDLLAVHSLLAIQNIGLTAAWALCQIVFCTAQGHE